MVWRYNMIQHLEQAHAEYERPGLPVGDRIKLPNDLWIDMEVTVVEEGKLGVPEGNRSLNFTGFEPPEKEDRTPATGNKRTADELGYAIAESSSKRGKLGSRGGRPAGRGRGIGRGRGK